MLTINPKYNGKKAYTIPTDPRLINLALNENFVKHTGIPETANFYFCDNAKLRNLKTLLASHCGALEENLLITNGSGQALKLILDVFVGPTTRIGILFPNYPGFIHDAELSQGEVILKPCTNNDDFDNIDISDVNIFYMSNPNLPYGYFISNEKINKLVELNPNILFIIDEAYGEYMDEKSTLILRSNILITKTLSKAFGLAGMRVGYIIAPPNLNESLKIAYDSKTLTHEAIHYATLVMQNRNYYLDQLHEFSNAMEIFRQKIEKLCFRGTSIYNVLFTKCPWFILQCKNPPQVCQIFVENGFLVRDKSNEITGAVRITFAPQYAEIIEKIIKSINFNYEKLIFDLDGTMRATYNSPIEPFIVKKWPELVEKYSARIITNNSANRESIMQMLESNGIHNADVISPITMEMNPHDAEWFIYNDELYLLKFPTIFSHELAVKITSTKQINIIEIGDTTPSAELDLLPNVPLPHIGLLLKYVKIVNPKAIINIIGKTSLMMNIISEKTLMIGDTDIDKEFAEKNNFDFYDVRIAPLEKLIENL